MAIREFIGRTKELEKLRNSTSKTAGPKITALYGRRRIGKTRLVKEAFSNHKFLQFEGLEGEGSAEQRKHFARTLYRYSGEETHRTTDTSDWSELLILLAEYTANEPCVVLFDEFQWMAANRTQLVGKLKYVWDNFFAENTNVHLVLCGSISSFLVNKVIRSKALYGRIDNIIHLGPLNFGEVKNGFFKKRSVLEALEYYLLMGGVPKYLELFEPRKSVRLNVSELCFSPNAYFVNEFERLFISHFGKTTHYRELVKHLAFQGFSTRTEIAKHLGFESGGSLSTLLDNLELAGFIETYSPLQNPSSTHLRRFRLRDPYLRFYFKFIEPNLNKINSPKGLPLHIALPDSQYNVFLGLSFEHFCYQHSHIIARQLGFSSVDYDAGSWYRKSDLASGAQIDLLFKRADRVLTLCEVKHRQKVGREVIREIEKKRAALSSWKHYTIEPVLITALPPTEELRGRVFQPHSNR